MSLTEAYLRKIRFWIPSRRRRATLPRIAEDLQEFLDVAQNRTGRPITDAEMVGLLNLFGSPPVVATRYAPEAPLIPGCLMVAYRRVMAVAALGVVLIQSVVLLIALSRAEPGWHGLEVTSAGGRAVYGLLIAFAVVTLAFAALGRIYAPRERTPP